MKAIAIDGYGDAGELQPREAPDPKPGDEEILIRVRAAGVNPLDWKIRQGQLRLFLRLRFPYVLGSDIAGEVVSTGILAKRFKPGDPVFAFSDPRRAGAHAELAVVNQAAAARKPNSLDFAETASLPIAGCTALQALRDIGCVSQGAKVLVHGGAGGSGHFAVQIAKALGAMTTATCGPANIDFVRSGLILLLTTAAKTFSTAEIVTMSSSTPLGRVLSRLAATRSLPAEPTSPRCRAPISSSGGRSSGSPSCSAKRNRRG